MWATSLSGVDLNIRVLFVSSSGKGKIEFLIVLNEIKHYKYLFFSTVASNRAFLPQAGLEDRVQPGEGKLWIFAVKGTTGDSSQNFVGTGHHCQGLSSFQPLTGFHCVDQPDFYHLPLPPECRNEKHEATTHSLSLFHEENGTCFNERKNGEFVLGPQKGMV